MNLKYLTKYLKIDKALIFTSVVGLLGISMFFSNFHFWACRPQSDLVKQAYQRGHSSVANIQVEPAGVTGSGIVLDNQGHLLTNYHVIQNANSDAEIRAHLVGLGKIPVSVVGYDIATDLAVLQASVDPDLLTAARFSDSDEVEVGDLVIAIGNPYGYSQSLTVGFISAVGRRLLSGDPYAPDVENVFQTDAAINPGNSGGPLFNRKGEIIGINTRIESPNGGSVGVGFAISSNLARRIAEELIRQGYVRRPFLGVKGQPTTIDPPQGTGQDTQRGLRVWKVAPGSPAAKAGLRAESTPRSTTAVTLSTGDVILAADGRQIYNQSTLNQAIARHNIGETIRLTILRDGQFIQRDIRLEKRAAGNHPILASPVFPSTTHWSNRK